MNSGKRSGVSQSRAPLRCWRFPLAERSPATTGDTEKSIDRIIFELGERSFRCGQIHNMHFYNFGHILLFCSNPSKLDVQQTSLRGWFNIEGGL
jgi:hypothetical protein